MSDTNIIEMQEVNKRFGGIHALKNVTFAVKRGTIHGLVGENGAGKSTLMKILTGVYRKDSGKIFINNIESDIHNMKESQNAGIALLPQELSLVPFFTVAENIYLGKEHHSTKTGLINWKKLYSDSAKLLNELEINLDPRKQVKNLSVSDQQMTAIAKILSYRTDVIIFDEPTARLGRNETQHLLGYIKKLRTKGISIIFISHHLSEVFDLCDEITVLRDGETIITAPAAELTEEIVVKKMVDREIAKNVRYRTNKKLGEEIFNVKNLTNKNVRNINISLRSGEILGISGLVGAGRTEMARAIMGLDKKDSGTITLHNKEIQNKNIRDSIKHGLAIIPEERRSQGVILDLTIRENISLVNSKSISRMGFINKRKETNLAESLSNMLNVRKSTVEQKVRNLSGGNQQKVVIAKWMGLPIEVLIFDEPTRGIDVGAKTEVYKLMNEMANKGKSIIMISSEIPELQAICDRVLVMKKGEVKAELNENQLAAEEIIVHAIESK